MPIPVAEAAAGHVPAPDHDVVATLHSATLKHVGEDSLVVLKVAVHDGDEPARSSTSMPFDTGGGQPPTPDPLETAHPMVGAGLRTRTTCGRPVRRVVVDDDQLPLLPQPGQASRAGPQAGGYCPAR
jgi:hypothetical protein